MQVDDYTRRAEAALRRGVSDHLSGPEQQSVEFAEAQVWATLAAAQAQQDANLIALASATNHDGAPHYPGLAREAERLARDWEYQATRPPEPNVRPPGDSALPAITPPPTAAARTAPVPTRTHTAGSDRTRGVPIGGP